MINLSIIILFCKFQNYQVSGITFAFDPKKPPGSRVDSEFVKVSLTSQFCFWNGSASQMWFFKVGDEYLDMEQRYKLVTKAYLGKGKDGYDSFSKAEVNLQPSHKSPLTQLSCHQSAASRITQLIQSGDGRRGDSAKPDLSSSKPLPGDQNEAGQGVYSWLLYFCLFESKQR